MTDDPLVYVHRGMRGYTYHTRTNCSALGDNYREVRLSALNGFRDECSVCENPDVFDHGKCPPTPHYRAAVDADSGLESEKYE